MKLIRIISYNSGDVTYFISIKLLIYISNSLMRIAFPKFTGKGKKAKKKLELSV